MDDEAFCCCSFVVSAGVICSHFSWFHLLNISDYCRGDDQNTGPDATSLRIIELLGNQEKNPILYYVDNYIFGVSEWYLWHILSIRA